MKETLTPKKIFLSLFVVSLWAIASVFFFFSISFFVVFKIVFKSSSLESAVRELIRLYGWILVRLSFWFVPVEVENRAGILPLPVVFVANHSSAIDPYLFGLIACENAFVTSWPFRIPIHNLVMRMAGYIDAREGWSEIERQGKRLLGQGCSVTIWPEGHRSRDGRLQRFRKGAFKLAVAADRPVVPVCINGSGEILPPGHRLLCPGRIRIVVLPPIISASEGDSETRTVLLMDEVYRCVRDELSRHGVKHKE